MIAVRDQGRPGDPRDEQDTQSGEAITLWCEKMLDHAEA